MLVPPPGSKCLLRQLPVVSVITPRPTMVSCLGSIQMILLWIMTDLTAALPSVFNTKSKKYQACASSKEHQCLAPGCPRMYVFLIYNIAILYRAVRSSLQRPRALKRSLIDAADGRLRLVACKTRNTPGGAVVRGGTAYTCGFRMLKYVRRTTSFSPFALKSNHVVN